MKRELRDHVRASAANRPGVYRMLDARGEVLYVGKSKHVRSRLLSYFRAKRGEKGERLLSEAAAVEWDYEPSEFAALLRELRLIKRHRPRYNVRHRRDARYSFVRLTATAAPKLFVVRRVRDEAGAHFGPFRRGRRIAAALRELNDVLGLRDCALSTPMAFADQGELFSFDRAPRCPRYELGRCAAPCAARCTETDYGSRVSLGRRFLGGECDEPLRRLERRMDEAAERWQYELAASLRDRLSRLEVLRDELTRLRTALETLSFVYRVAGAEGDDRVYLIRRGTVRDVLPAPVTSADERRLQQRAREVFSAPEPHTPLITRDRAEEMLLLAAWFRAHPEERGASCRLAATSGQRPAAR